MGVVVGSAIRGRSAPARRVGLAVLLLYAVSVPAVSASGQALDRPPNMGGVWTAAPGVVHFHVLHRFQVLDPPSRKVVNSPTLRVAAGLAEGAQVGVHYATSSLLVPAKPNEWEAFARWAPLRQSGGWVDGAVRTGWNGTAESVDGELSVARSLGALRLHVAGRGFSAWRGGDAGAALAVGALWRLHRWVALAGDVVRHSESEEETGWSAGLQLAIPYTPHTLSIHASNVNATTLQSASAGVPDRRLWGFEFTVPITLSRYFGGGPPAQSGDPAPEDAPGVTGSRADTARVTMDNRLRFLPDTVRIRAGDVVVWRNTSDIIHTVTADPDLAVEPTRVRLPEGAAAFHSGDLVPGAVFSRRFTVPGEYRYICMPHEAAGMTGVVIVMPAP